MGTRCLTWQNKRRTRRRAFYLFIQHAVKDENECSLKTVEDCENVRKDDRLLADKRQTERPGQPEQDFQHKRTLYPRPKPFRYYHRKICFRIQSLKTNKKCKWLYDDGLVVANNQKIQKMRMLLTSCKKILAKSSTMFQRQIKVTCKIKTCTTVLFHNDALSTTCARSYWKYLKQQHFNFSESTTLRRIARNFTISELLSYSNAIGTSNWSNNLHYN